MKKQMKKGVAIGLFVVLVSVGAGISLVSACANLGPGKHMGVVKMIDPIKGVFTLVDAETRRSIRFRINDDLLKKVKISNTIVVTYQAGKDGLVAKEIVVHPVSGSFSSTSPVYSL